VHEVRPGIVFCQVQGFPYRWIQLRGRHHPGVVQERCIGPLVETDSPSPSRLHVVLGGSHFPPFAPFARTKTTRVLVAWASSLLVTSRLIVRMMISGASQVWRQPNRGTTK
jgi:hypothetical protein